MDNIIRTTRRITESQRNTTIKQTLIVTLVMTLALVLAELAIAQTIAPLASWNDGKAKQSIIDFVARVTKEGSSDFVPARSELPRSITMARFGPSSRCISNSSSRSIA